MNNLISIVEALNSLFKRSENSYFIILCIIFVEFPRSVCLFVIAADDCDTHSVTALACKSLNLSQALHEKCLHLELSSSDEDDTLRNLQVPIQNFPPSIGG